jgi:heme exporter protein A
MGPTEAVNVAKLSKTFGKKVVLQDVNLSVATGESVCICGANAVGKTTLLSIIAGLLRPSSGSIKIFGFDVSENAGKIKPRLGYISHEPMIYPQLTVEENLHFFARLYGIEDIEGRKQELLELTELTNYRFAISSILSTGMMQRLSIARAILHKPSILLADEPFANLDQKAAEHLVTIMKNYKDSGGTVIMAGHNVRNWLGCCSRVIVLEDKKIMFDKQVSQIDVEDFSTDYISYAGKNS